MFTQVVFFIQIPFVIGIVILYVIELVMFYKEMITRQAWFNIIAIVALILYSAGWMKNGDLIRVIFSALPFVLNFADLFHLKKEKNEFLIINGVETFLCLLLIILSVYMKWFV